MSAAAGARGAGGGGHRGGLSQWGGGAGAPAGRPANGKRAAVGAGGACFARRLRRGRHPGLSGGDGQASGSSGAAPLCRRGPGCVGQKKRGPLQTRVVSGLDHQAGSASPAAPGRPASSSRAFVPGSQSELPRPGSQGPTSSASVEGRPPTGSIYIHASCPCRQNPQSAMPIPRPKLSARPHRACWATR